jgi:hypothetical protein
MNKIITEFKLFEGKNIQNVYHIVNVDNLRYILDNNEITSYKYPKISTTRNKMMNFYIGSTPDSIFKLELDGSKLSDHYKMVSYQDSGWEPKGKFFLKEWEEQVQTDRIKNAKKYIVKIILIKNIIEDLKKTHGLKNTFLKNIVGKIYLKYYLI